jgi:nicotinamide-nucleotide amidase
VPGPDDVAAADLTFRVVRALAERGLTLATAESLTGGGLTAELTRVPGASAVVLGGAIVYSTELKHDLLGVEADLLEREGPVHPEVARQLAEGARRHLAVGGRAADLGVSTTGVAGPDPQGGRAVGTVYVGIASASGVRAVELRFTGDRQSIRAQTVARAVLELAAEVGIGERRAPSAGR